MKYLAIYLKDHYAGSTLGIELAKRAAKQQRAATPSSARRSARLADRDRRGPRRAQADHGPPRRRPSTASRRRSAGRPRRPARLKPNGHLLRFSPLSRVVEIEGLITGVSGKLSLWRALLEIVPNEPRLDEDSLTRLAERAEDQLLRLHALRGAAAMIAFGRAYAISLTAI